MQRILITGAAGFIGSHLAEFFLGQGAEVAGLDNMDPFYSLEVKKSNLSRARQHRLFKFYETDILDEAGLNEILTEIRPDLIFHFAARAGVRPSLQNPASYMRTNVEGTANVLEGAVRLGQARVIVASSSSVYGDDATVPFRVEEGPLLPISPYGASKLATEALCHAFAKSKGLPVIALRFFTVYGPRQRPDLAIHKFLKRMRDGQEIELFGDGSTSRDYTYIEDIIDGIVGASGLDLSHDRVPYRVYNLGSESPITLREMVETLERVSGIKARIKPLPEQAGDVKRTYAELSRSQRDFGYRPKYNFERGVANFWSWLRQQEG